MSHDIYKRAGTSQLYEKIGNAGSIPKAIERYVTDESANGAKYPIRWHLPVARLLKLLSDDPEWDALIIDLTPNAKKTVTLLEVKDIWGVTHEDTRYTPVGLRLELLFERCSQDDPPEFKRKFDATSCRRDVVREFLYLQPKLKKDGTLGKLQWGPVGSVNGPLMWPHVWDYIVGEMSKK